MWISDTSIKRPVFATMLVMSLVVLGIFSFRDLGVDLFPRADPATVTALHFAEYVADLPGKKRVRWDYVVAGSQGAPEHVWIDCLDDAHGIADWEGEDYFSLILKACLAVGRHCAGLVGKAQGELLEAADLVAFGARGMERNLAPPR